MAFWSSLDWYTNNGKSRWFEWVGTAYDVMVHILMAYALSPNVWSKTSSLTVVKNARKTHFIVNYV